MHTRSITTFVALVIYLGMLFFPFLASVLLAPAEGVAILLAGWAVGALAAFWLVRRRSWWVVAVPPLALAYWAAVITAGERLFDWTA